MAVNLFKAQDDLNNLIGQAKTPEQISAAKVYLNQLANGANKEIPQFMALNVLNQMESSNPTPPPPTGTLKDKLTGIAPQQPQQGMPPQQGAPVQGAPMPAPQQHPQAMTSGGIAHLPVDEKMYNFKEGGVIGFNTGDPVPEPTFKGLYNQAKQEAADYAQNMEKPVDPDVARAQYIKDHPEMAMLGQLPGQELQKGITKQEAAQNAEYQRQLDQGKTNQAMGLSNALLQAAEQTRGTRGLGGLGPALAGFGGTFNASTKEEQERVNKLNATKQEKDLLILKYKSDLESAQRAAAEGRFSEKLAYQHSMADSINKAKLMGFDLDSKALTSAAGIEEANIHAAATNAAANRPTDVLQIANALVEDSAKQGKPMTMSEAINQTFQEKAAGADIGAQERKMAVILNKRTEAAKSPFIMAGMMAPPGSPKRIQAEADLQQKYKEIDDEVNLLYGGKSTSSATPAPTQTNPLLPPPSSGGWGQSTVVPNH